MSIGDLATVSNVQWKTGTVEFIHALRISDTVYAVVSSDAGYDGWLHTLGVDAAGALNATPLASLEFDTTLGTQAHICHVSGNIYAITYQGPDYHGWLKTVSISSDGATLSVVDSYEFDGTGTWTKQPRIFKHGTSTTYVIIYAGTLLTDYGAWVIAVTIADDGTITKSIIDYTFYDLGYANFDFESNHLSGDVFAFVWAYNQNNIGCNLATILVTSAGNVSAVADTYAAEATVGRLARIYPTATATMYVLIYGDYNTKYKMDVLTINETTGAITDAALSSTNILDDDEVTMTTYQTVAFISVIQDMYFITYNKGGSAMHCRTFRISSAGVNSVNDYLDDEQLLPSFGLHYWATLIKTLSGDGYLYVLVHNDSSYNGETTSFSVVPTSVYPSDAIARVSSIRHVYRPGFYRMEVGLGALGFDIDVAEALIRRAVAAEISEAEKIPTCPPGTFLAWSVALGWHCVEEPYE